MNGDWERVAKILQQEKNEQYEEIKKLKALNLTLLAFIHHRDWLNVKYALDLED